VKEDGGALAKSVVAGGDAFMPPSHANGEEDDDDDDIVGPVLPMTHEQKAAATSRGECVLRLFPSPFAPLLSLSFLTLTDIVRRLRLAVCDLASEVTFDQEKDPPWPPLSPRASVFPDEERSVCARTRSKSMKRPGTSCPVVDTRG
jgi:hypothetical protein